MRVKKSLFIIVFIFIFSINCYGINDFKILKTPKVEYETSYILPVKSSMKNEALAIAKKIKLDFYSINSDVALKISGNSTDTVLSIGAIPFSINFFESGLGIKYHLYDWYDSFLEHDFLLNQYFAFLYKNIVRIQVNTGFDYKIVSFKNKIINPLYYKTFYLGIDLFWNINKMIQVYASANTMDDFDFSLIGAPIYKIGGNINIRENILVGCNYATKMIDMVAVAENASETLLSLYMRVLF